MDACVDLPGGAGSAYMGCCIFSVLDTSSVNVIEAIWGTSEATKNRTRFTLIRKQQQASRHQYPKDERYPDKNI
jgi:hypothetical protein